MQSIKLQNTSIQEIALETSSTGLSYAGEFIANFSRSGAFTFFGKSNVNHLGEHKGAVNFYEFDLIASVMATSGFLDITPTDDSQSPRNKITIVERDISNTFERDDISITPIFWAMVQLLQSMIERARWGDSAFIDCFTSMRWTVGVIINRDSRYILRQLCPAQALAS